MVCGAGITWLWSKDYVVVEQDCVSLCSRCYRICGLSYITCPTYRCLPCGGSGAYARSNTDLVNLKTPNKTKQTNKQEFIYCKSKWRGIHCDQYMLCITVTASFMVKKICCVFDDLGTSQVFMFKSYIFSR